MSRTLIYRNSVFAFLFWRTQRHSRFRRPPAEWSGNDDGSVGELISQGVEAGGAAPGSETLFLRIVAEPIVGPGNLKNFRFRDLGLHRQSRHKERVHVAAHW